MLSYSVERAVRYAVKKWDNESIQDSKLTHLYTDKLTRLKTTKN